MSCSVPNLAFRWNHIAHPLTKPSSIPPPKIKKTERIGSIALCILLSLPTLGGYAIFFFATAYWKTKTIQVYSPTSPATSSPKPSPSPNPPPPLSPLEQTIAKIRQLSLDVEKEGKSLCLFVGRSANQSLPENDREIWVSLDIEETQNIPPSRLHLQMDVNDSAQTEKIARLFDKVVTDLAVTQFICGDHWTKLHTLLKPKPTATLITEAIKGMCGIAEGNAIEYRLGYIDLPESQCTNSFVDEIHYKPSIAENQKLIEENKKHLQTLFRHVEVRKNTTYPCRDPNEGRPWQYPGANSDKDTYYILRNPIILPPSPDKK